MCARYFRRSDKQHIAEAFHLGKLPDGFVLPPDYNIAPTTFQPVIRADKEFGERELVAMRWGRGRGYGVDREVLAAWGLDHFVPRTPVQLYRLPITLHGAQRKPARARNLGSLYVVGGFLICLLGPLLTACRMHAVVSIKSVTVQNSSRSSRSPYNFGMPSEIGCKTDVCLAALRRRLLMQSPTSSSSWWTNRATCLWRSSRCLVEWFSATR